MIVSFKHKGLKRYYDKGDTSLIRQDQVQRIRRIIGLLDLAREMDEIAVPGLKLHPLTGDMKGFWSVSVSGNWRIIFRFEDAKAYDVDLIDYH